jgi:hypothetical protein
MQEKQRVAHMAVEVLARQAEARAKRTGETLEEAQKAVLETEAGQQLTGLRDGTHRDEAAERWQDELAPKRAKKRNQSRQEDSRQEDYRKVRVNDEDYREHQSAIRHRRSSLR